MERSLRNLLNRIVDYAGLFPPASLDMETAVRHFREHSRSEDAWMLGRFVLPATRLDEFGTASPGKLPRRKAEPAWRLSALIGDDLAGDLQLVHEFNARHRERVEFGAAVVDAVELKASTVDEIDAKLLELPRTIERFVEIPIDQDPRPLIARVIANGARTKVRTGGTTPDAFPDTETLMRFILRSVELQAPFKATAGLHHPLRAQYRLTYETNAPQAPMFGFLNLFLTAAGLRKGMSTGEAKALLEEGETDAFRLEPGAVWWRRHRFPSADIVDLRRHFALSFGSCSFREPVDELRSLQFRPVKGAEDADQRAST